MTQIREEKRMSAGTLRQILLLTDGCSNEGGDRLLLRH